MILMKRHLFWIVELFVWFLILVTVSGLIMTAKYTYKKQFNTYQIFMPDVDGLIVGSPVKLLGINVGYVNQLDIVGEDIYVKFVITEKEVRVPAGSKVTVEFSGLGGSKSLEIYPPESKKQPGGKFLIVQSPKRIHDSLGLLSDMFDKIIDITYTTSNFMEKVGILKNQSSLNNTKPNHIIETSNGWLDRAQKNADNISNILIKKNGRKNGTIEQNKSEDNK